MIDPRKLRLQMIDERFQALCEALQQDEPTVQVRRQWNDVGRIATYRVRDVSGVHWDSLSGGVMAPTPRPFLHGYVSCESMLSGELSHSGTHGPCPHEIKVCIVKKDNNPKVFAYFEDVARLR